MAPETFSGQPYNGVKADVWSTGIILYAMTQATVPFKASNLNELQDKIKKGQLIFRKDKSPPLSEDLQDLIALILNIDPAERLNISDIFQHRWMK